MIALKRRWIACCCSWDIWLNTSLHPTNVTWSCSKRMPRISPSLLAEAKFCQVKRSSFLYASHQSFFAPKLPPVTLLRRSPFEKIVKTKFRSFSAVQFSVLKVREKLLISFGVSSMAFSVTISKVSLLSFESWEMASKVSFSKSSKQSSSAFTVLLSPKEGSSRNVSSASRMHSSICAW